MAKQPMLPSAIDFDREIHIIDWLTNEKLYSLPCFLGLLAMSDSSRYDTNHVTAQVRVLAESDRFAANALHDGPKTPLEKGQPVYFTQHRI
jgi:hypothetical protein